jgi:hypothetical protein
MLMRRRPTASGSLSSTSSSSSSIYDLYGHEQSYSRMIKNNFGIDKQGHLYIDYSQNWKGLERYVKKLHI